MIHALTDFLMQQFFAYGLHGVGGLHFLVQAAPATGNQSFGQLSQTFFSDLLNTVLKTAQQNAVVLLKDGFHLLNILLLIMVIWKCLQLALKQGSFSELIGELFSLIWTWGMAAWFLHSEDSYKLLTGYINNGFDYIGYKLATGQGPSASDPNYMSNMLTKGEGVILGAINHIWQHMEEMFNNGNVPAILELVDGIMNVFTIIVLLFAGMYFFIVFASSQILVFIALSLGPIFIPWLMTPITKDFFFSWLKFTCVAGMFKVMGMLIAVFGGSLLDWVNTKIKNVVATANNQLNQTGCATPMGDSSGYNQSLVLNPGSNGPDGCLMNAPDPTAAQGDLMLGVVKNDLAYIVIAVLLAWMMQQVPGWANGILSGSARVYGSPLGELRSAKRAALKALRMATKALAVATGVGGIAAAGEMMAGGWKKVAKSAAGRGMNAAGRHMDRSSALMSYYTSAGKDIAAGTLKDRFDAWRQRAGEQGNGGDNNNPPDNPPNEPPGGSPGGPPGDGSGGAPPERTMAGGDGSDQRPSHHDAVNGMLNDPSRQTPPASGNDQQPSHHDAVNGMLNEPNRQTPPATGDEPALRENVDGMLNDPGAPQAPPGEPQPDATDTTAAPAADVSATAATAAADAAALAASQSGAGQAAAPAQHATEYRGGKPFATRNMRSGGTVGGYQTFTADGPARPRAGYHMTYWPDGTPRDIKIDGYEDDFAKGLQKMHPDDQAKIQGLSFVTDPAEYARQAHARGYDAHTGLPNDHPVASRHDPGNRPGRPGNVGHRQFDNVREGPDHPVHGQTWITREGSMSFQRTWDGKAVSAWLTQHPEISSKDVETALKNPKEYGLNMGKFHTREALAQLAAEKNYKAPPAGQLPPKPPWLLKRVPPVAAARQFRQAVFRQGVRSAHMPSSGPRQPAPRTYRELGMQTQDRQAGALVRYKQAVVALAPRIKQQAFYGAAMRRRGMQQNTPKPGQKVSYSRIGANTLERAVADMGKRIAQHDKKNGK